LKIILLLAVLILSSSTAEIMLTRGMRTLGDVTFEWRGILRGLRQGLVNASLISGVLLMVLSFFTFLSLLGFADLSYVLPLGAASYVVSTVGAKFILKEQISRQRWTGAAFVTLGVFLVSIPNATAAPLAGMLDERLMAITAHPVTTALLHALQALVGVLVIASIVYNGIALWAAGRWHADRRKQRALGVEFTPPVTMLIPVYGLDAAADRIFSRLCEQDYPDYQIVFGVRDRNDPVVEPIRRLMRDHPDTSIDLVISDQQLGTNAKVSNLNNMLARARHEVVVILDSDILVTPDYLRRVIAPLRREKVGAVTCLYRGVEARSWASLLENIGISTTFAAEVVTARALDGVRFTLGSTIAMRRDLLDSLGGFRAVADYLADDFRLGQLVTGAGYEIVLSDYVVEHVSDTKTFGSILQHQVRWGRSTRLSRPRGYLGLIFTYASATSLLFLLVMNFSPLAWRLVAVAMTLRMSVAWVYGRRLMADRTLSRFLILVPFRDILGFYVWLKSLFGDQVRWRGTDFTVFPSGKFRAVHEGEKIGWEP